MKTFLEQLKTAEKRYYIAQLVGLFMTGIFSGALIGWILWS